MWVSAGPGGRVEPGMWLGNSSGTLNLSSGFGLSLMRWRGNKSHGVK